MVGKCYLCDRQTSKRERISLHKFPKNPILRNKWIEACDLSLSDNLTHVYICSLHFDPKTIYRGLEFQSRCILRSGAVPSIGVPNPIYSNNENKNIVNRRNDNIVETNQVEIINVDENYKEMDNVYINKYTSDNVNTNPPAHNVIISQLPVPINASNKDPLKLCNDFIKQHGLGTTATTLLYTTLPYTGLSPTDATIDSEINRNFGNSEEICDSNPKRRVYEPRYISEIQISDFRTPKHTKRILDMVRNTDKKKTKLIKSLQNRNRALEKRVSKLKTIIADLKKKGHGEWKRCNFVRK